MARRSQRRTYRRLPQSRTVAPVVVVERPNYDQLAADLVKAGVLPITCLDRPLNRKDTDQ